MELSRLLGGVKVYATDGTVMFLDDGSIVAAPEDLLNPGHPDMSRATNYDIYQYIASGS